MGNYLSAPVTAKRTEWGTTASGLPYAISCMQGWRVSMEDTHIAVPSLLHHSHNLSLFACFDGHGGKFASNFARNKFVSVLRETEEYIEFERMEYEERDDRNKGIALLRSALHECFLALDAKMLFEGSARASCTVGRDVSGCTALIIIVTPKFVLCANAGDSRAVLTKVDKDGLLDELVQKKASQNNTNDNNKEPKYLAIPLSHDHRPSSQSEKERIHKAGGRIVHQRIEGDLGVSRGLGDFRYKRNQSPEEQIVTCVPEISIHERCNDADQFIVMGCDGIWDVHAKKDIIGQIVIDLSIDSKDVAHACEEILDLCLKKGSKDNMTALLLVLPGLKYSPKVLKQSIAANNSSSSHTKENGSSAKVLTNEEKKDKDDHDEDQVEKQEDIDNVSVNLDNKVVVHDTCEEDSQKQQTNDDTNESKKDIAQQTDSKEKDGKEDDEVEMVQGEL